MMILQNPGLPKRDKRAEEENREAKGKNPEERIKIHQRWFIKWLLEKNVSFSKRFFDLTAKMRISPFFDKSKIPPDCKHMLALRIAQATGSVVVAPKGASIEDFILSKKSKSE